MTLYRTWPKSNSSITPRMQRGSVTIIHTKPQLQSKTDLITKKNIRLPPPVRFYNFNVHLGMVPQVWCPSFAKQTCLLNIPICTILSAIFTVPNLFYSGAIRNFINMDFLPPASKDPIMSTKSPQPQTVSSEVVKIEGPVPLFIHIGDRPVFTWFVIVEILVVDIMLETSFIARFIRRIFYSAQNHPFAFEARGN